MDFKLGCVRCGSYVCAGNCLGLYDYKHAVRWYDAPVKLYSSSSTNLIKQEDKVLKQVNIREYENGYTVQYDGKDFVLDAAIGAITIRDNKAGLKVTIEVIEQQDDVVSE